MNKTTITISGPFGCGKTTVQAIIGRELEKHGFAVEYSEEDEPGWVLDQKLDAYLRGFDAARSDGRAVSIRAIKAVPPDILARDRERQTRPAR